MFEIPRRSQVDITFDSVNDINGIIDGTEFTHWTAEEKKAHVKRNADHLTIVKSGTYIDLAQFSAAQIAEIDAAIARGNSYVSSL